MCCGCILVSMQDFNGHIKHNVLVIGLLGKGDPGTTGGNQLKLKKSTPQYRGLSGLLAFFSCPRIGDIFRGQWVAAIVTYCLIAFLISPGWRLCFQIMPEGSGN